MNRTQPIVTLALAALAVGCTDVRLWKPGQLERVSVELDRPSPIEPDQTWGFVPKPGEQIRYQVGDVFCTPPSLDATIPFKLLIIMDYSGSMDDNDGGGIRIQRVAELVQSYANDEAIHFGFLRFNETFYETSLGQDFTNDQTQLTQVLGELAAANNQDATNYQVTLRWAWDAIEADRTRPDQVPGTRYGILFITDGRPNEPEQGGADAALLANRPKVRDLITGCDGFKDFQPLNTMIEFLNTYFIATAPDPLATALLQDMAEGTSLDPCGPNNWGRGQYYEVNDVADLQFDLDLPEIRKEFINRSGFVFMNHHLRAQYKDGEMVMARDSDGDGIPDFEESANPDPGNPFATDMFSADTDNDGISDLVSRAIGRATNQQAPEEIFDRPPSDPYLEMFGMLTQLGKIERSEYDTDGDGLTDTEENLLGTDRLYVDTDQDGLSDYTELRYGLNANLANDASLDADGDGFDSKAEIETGMDPFHKEPAWFRTAYAYQITRGDEFEVETPRAGQSPEVRTCYNFRVANILFRRPLRPGGAQGELNLFELSFIDQVRMPLDQREYLSRRETIIARPEDDRPNYYFQRTYPVTW